MVDLDTKINIHVFSTLLEVEKADDFGLIKNIRTYPLATRKQDFEIASLGR
jgi:hypothetical protein